jgi:hypothetical protein
MKLLLRSLLLSLSVVVFATTLSAQTIRVKAGATGAGNGTTWADAYPELKDALAAATTGAEIWVAAGTYKPAANPDKAMRNFALDKKVSLYGGFAGTETSLAARNITANATLLSGDSLGNDVAGNFTTNRADNSYHVVFASVTGCIVDGFTIRGGVTQTATVVTTLNHRGGGLLSISPITVRNCRFTDNSGTAGGGCAIAGADASNSVIENCVFEGNSSNLQGNSLHLESLAGAIVKKCTFKNNTGARGAMHTRFGSAITMDSCVFDSNTGTASSGGAYYNWNSSITILRTAFINNAATNGGGAIYNDQRDRTSFVSIQKCDFEGNKCTAASTRGGAVVNFNASLQMDDCKFKNNSSIGSGGAINNSTGTKYNYNNCEFEGNMGLFGGACINYDTTAGTYNYCKFTANVSANAGGGAMSYGFQARGTINFCEFESNTGAIGGAVYAQNDNTMLSVNGSTFSSNESTSGGGAMYLRAGSFSNIDQTNFIGNKSVNGGALNVSQDSITRPKPTVTISRSSFILNEASTQGAAFNLSNANTVLTNCAIGGNTNTGTAAGGGFSNNASGPDTSTLRLVNCTVANNSATIGAGVALWQQDSTGAKSILSTFNTIYENIGDNYKVEDGTPTVLSSGGNHSSDASFAALLNGASDVNGLPAQFVDASLEDYNLNPGSPCINTAIATGAPTYDFNGGFRGTMPDKGAYERGSVGAYAPANDFELTLAPNPTSGLLVIQVPAQVSGPTNVLLYTAGGALVQSLLLDLQGQAIRLDMTQLPAGAYQLRVQVGTQQSGEMVVKI